MPPAISEMQPSTPVLRGAMRRRMAETAALLLACAAMAVLVALVSYNAHDPSLNTATGLSPTNLAGPPGAIAADLLLQGFGLAGALPGLALLGWAWRIGAHRGLSAPLLRLAALLAAMPALAGVLAAIPVALGQTLAWPAAAGLGGAIGASVAADLASAGRDMLGPMGAILLWLAGAALSGLLAVLALGLTAGEWRAAGRAARISAGHARGASNVISRATQALVAGATWLLRTVNGTREEPLHRVVGQDPSPPRRPGE